MRGIQEIFNEIESLKTEQKEIRLEYKDALKNADEYEEVSEKIKELRDSKKRIKSLVQNRLGLRWRRAEEIKTKIKELDETLTDVAMTNLMDGKTIGVKDKFENEYEPVYKINFKKRS